MLRGIYGGPHYRITDMKLTHLALTVSSMERSLPFYEEFTSLVCVHRRQNLDGSTVVWLSDADLKKRFVLVLLELPKDNGALTGINHLGFGVSSRSEVDDLAKRADAKGCLEMKPTYKGPVVGYICFVRDPDGNSLEFSHGQELGDGESDEP